GLNFVAKTSDNGDHWTKISGELGIPAGLDSMAAANLTNGRGAIESMSVSTVSRGVIWVGTSNGLIHVTRDEGKTWKNVSVPNLPIPRRANISAIDASHHAAGTAYVAIEYLRGGDHTPYIFRTKDYGATWTKITDGLPEGEAGGSFVRVVREDPVKAGLLFAGTESHAYVSFDDGGHWQSLANNLPNSPVRDMLVKGNDLVIATHGRGFWILDNISMLRQLTPMTAADNHLFAPGKTVRMRRNVNSDTPLPPEVPHALNPMDGAIIDYWLASKPSGVITLDVKDSAGKAVRHLSSADIKPVSEAARPPHPNFWVLDEKGIPANAGANRTNWDLRYDSPNVFNHSYEISANPGLTPPSPEGELAPPGTYTLTLKVDGKAYIQRVTVVNDPRSPASAAAIAAQHVLLREISAAIEAAWAGAQQVAAVRAALDTAGASPVVVSAIAAFRAKVDSVGGGGGGGRRGGGGAGPTFRSLNGQFAGQLGAQDNADHAPNGPMRAAYSAACKDLAKVQARWSTIATKDLSALNAVLAANGKNPIPAPSVRAPVVCR
ncbi:MAG TPA: hypothetical protein VF483_09790, partial [Gemmatimonadaceae bacterium]